MCPEKRPADQGIQQKGQKPSMKDIHVITDKEEEFSPWANLANGIIEQAAHDYRKLGKKLQTCKEEERVSINREMIRISQFFLGSWFCCLSTADGAQILEILDMEVFDDDDRS